MTTERSGRALFACLAVLALSTLSVTILSGQRVCCEGDRWLKWSRETKGTYVFGYMLGYSKGHEDACQQATKDWPAPIREGIENDPLRKCSEQEMDFSKGSEFLAKAITELYNRYPEDRDIYPFEVLEQLGKGLSIEEVHQHPFLRHKRASSKP